MDLALAQAIAQVMSWPILGWLFLGILIGLALGLLPALGGNLFWAIALPFLFLMEPLPAYALIVGFMAVGTTSDTIPAILVSIPGSTAAQATIIDGHQMARKGQAARALGASFTAAVLGGIFGAIFLILSVPVIRPFVLSFGFPEFLMLALWGISMVAILSRGAAIKGLIAGVLGLLIGAIGQDVKTGYARWSFGTLYLMDGIPLALFGMAVFAVPELISLAVRRTQISEVRPVTDIVRGQLQGALDALRNIVTVIRGAIIGILVGVLPGIGASVGGWLAYGLEVGTAKDKSNFGKGDVRGVIAPDSTANATDGGTLIPVLAFGIPGSTGMAFLLLVLWNKGVRPGPDLLTKQVDVVYFFVAGLLVANIVGAAVCFIFANQLAKVSYVPYHFLFALAIPLMFLSAYQAKVSHWDLITLMVLSILGYTMRQLRWPRPPLVLGVVLSRTIESNLNVSYNLYGLAWLSRPIVLVLGVIILVGIVGPYLWPWYQKRKRAREEQLVTALLEAAGDAAARAAPPLLATPGGEAPARAAAALLESQGADAPAPAAPARRAFTAIQKADLGFALFLLGVVSYATFLARSFPPDPGRMPIVMGTVAIALLLLQGGKALLRPTSGESEEVLDVQADTLETPGLVLRRSAEAFAWILGMYASVVALGLLASLPLFAFLYLKRMGREGWKSSAVWAGSLALVAWLIFEKLMGLLWVEGILVKALLRLVS